MAEDPVVTLDRTQVSVAPGQQQHVTVTVANHSSRVQGYQLVVLGDRVLPWTQVEPAELDVFTDSEATAVLTLSPPASGPGALSGAWPFGVLARSTVDGSSAAAEGDVEVGEEHALQATIVPVTSQGRWRARHVLTVVNYGNTAALLRLEAADPDAALGFLLRPRTLAVPAGGTSHARLWVRTRRPVLRGAVTRLPFRVTAERADRPAPPGPPPVATTPQRPLVDAAFSQQPILGRAVVLLGTLVLVALLAGAAFTLAGPRSNASAYRDISRPATPVLQGAEPSGPGAVVVTWQPVPGVTGYKVTLIDPASGARFRVLDVDGGQNQVAVTELAADAMVCFQVVSVLDGVSSADSRRRCATTLPAASASLSASPQDTASSTPPATSPQSGPADSPATGSPSPFTGDQWVAAALPTVAVGDPPAGAADFVAAEQQKGVPAGYFQLQSYAQTVFPGLPTGMDPNAWVFYAGPFASQADAQQACAAVQTLTKGECYAVQPRT